MVNQELLTETVKKLLAPHKGILAADESNGTADKRLESVGVETGEEMRRKYRDLLLKTDGLEKYASGVILYDETFWQNCLAGESFVEALLAKDVVPGIKVDIGANEHPDFPDELITDGLEGMPERLAKYFDAGARFTKWRAVFKIDEDKGLPTDKAIKENSVRMAKYAQIAQEHGLVPIVEPEVLLLGKHSLETSEKITRNVVMALFDELRKLDVFLPGVILKTSMVISGNQNPDESSPDDVAEATARMLKESVPAETGGVVFLSGGQTEVESSAHLNEIAQREPLPWEIAFSFGRALQGPALRIWAGQEENVESARQELLKRLRLNQLADKGEYDINLEFAD